MMSEELTQAARLVFSDKRIIICIVFVLALLITIRLVETGVILLPGHTCAPAAWPSHSKEPLYIFDRNHNRWEECH